MATVNLMSNPIISIYQLIACTYSCTPERQVREGRHPGRLAPRSSRRLHTCRVGRRRASSPHRDRARAGHQQGHGRGRRQATPARAPFSIPAKG